MSLVLGIVVLIGGLAGLGYGVLELIAPQVAIRWQVSSTAKHKGQLRGQVGEAFQRRLRVDPAVEPWNDGTHRRQVRWIGAFLVTSGMAFIGIGIAVMVAS